jgi:RNA polymerase sigma-70 factor, ECF subfamily
MTAADIASLPDGTLARLIGASPRGADALAGEAELCRRFAPRIRLYGLRHLREKDAADDLVQRVLGLTLQKLRDGAVREPDRIASFVLGAARTMSRDWNRARTFEPLDADAEQAPAEAVRSPDPLAREQLARCVEALAERERAVIVLSFFQEQNADEIGKALGMKPGHVRVARHRAVGQLRDCMGVTEEAR